MTKETGTKQDPRYHTTPYPAVIDDLTLRVAELEKTVKEIVEWARWLDD